MQLDIEAVDRDGALREAAAGVPGETRKDFLLGTLAGGGAVLAALVLAEPGRAASKSDVAILNYALTLEYLQAAFYTEAERRKALRTPLARQTTRVLGAVERAHVTALQDALGAAAVARPSFDFRGTTEDEDAFIKTAVAFEDLGRPPTRARPIDSSRRRCSRRRSRSTPSRPGTLPGSATWPALLQPRARSTKRSRWTRPGASSPRRASSSRRPAPNRRRSRDSLADAPPCPRRWDGGARRRRRGLLALVGRGTDVSAAQGTRVARGGGAGRGSARAAASARARRASAAAVARATGSRSGRPSSVRSTSAPRPRRPVGSLLARPQSPPSERRTSCSSPAPRGARAGSGSRSGPTERRLGPA